MSASAPELCGFIHFFAHCCRHANRALSRIGTRQRIVEIDHDAIPGDLLQGRFVVCDQRARNIVKFAQDTDHFLWFGIFSKCGKSSQIAKYGGNLAVMAAHHLLQLFRAGGDDDIGDRRCQKSFQTAGSL